MIHYTLADFQYVLREENQLASGPCLLSESLVSCTGLITDCFTAAPVLAMEPVQSIINPSPLEHMMAGYLQENNFMIPHKSVGKMLNLHQFLSLILLSSSFSVSSDTHSIGKVLLVSQFVFSPNPPEFIMYLFNPRALLPG